MAVSVLKGEVKEYYNLPYAGGWSFRRRGEIVFLETLNFINLPSGAFSIGTLPEEFRPTYTVSHSCSLRAATARPPVAVIIESDGTVRGYNYGSAISGTTPAQDSIVYPTD